jgi:hypothetical protein
MLVAGDTQRNRFGQPGFIRAYGASWQTRGGTGLAEHGCGAPVGEGLIEAWNESSRPFVGVKSAGQILATMHRPFKKTVH